MSREITQTVGGKRIAWLIAIIAAFAVFVTLATEWSSASAASLSEPVDSQAISPSTNDLSTPNTNLPDIRGSTTSAVTDVANVFFGITDSVASTIGNTTAQSRPVELWAFVAVTVAFVVLLRVANMGPLVENASPRYIRRQEMGHRHTSRGSRSFAGTTFFNSASLDDDTGISKRFGLKRASHVAKAIDTLSAENTTTSPRKTHPVTSAIFGRLHAAFITFVGAVRTSNSYFRRAIASAGTAMISSLKRFGAGSAYPLIAPIVAGTVFTVHRNNAAATPGESELLRNTNTEHGRNIARGSPSSSMHQLWQPKPAAFALQI